jgi:hypothetical protein
VGWDWGFSPATPWAPDILTYFTQRHQTYRTFCTPPWNVLHCTINRTASMSILKGSDNGNT